MIVVRKPSLSRANGLWLTVLLSAMFQCLLAGEFGSDRTTTPDTATYLNLARDLQRWSRGEISCAGDLVRTPGYPLIILAVAATSGIDLDEVELPIRDWANTNEPGRRLTRRLILLQQFMGFLVPVLIFLLTHALTRRALLAFLCSLVYYWDISSVCYQFVLLTETATITTLVATLALLVAALRNPSRIRVSLLGLAVAWAILLRPSMLLLGPMMLAVLLIDGLSRRRLRAVTVILFVATSCSLPLLWSVCNRATYGHLFLTKNQTVTLQNFTGRYFAELDIADADLRVLQRHVRKALEDSPRYAMHRSLPATANELGEPDNYEMYRLVEQANRSTISAHPREFMKGGWQRFRAMWIDGFIDVKNRHAQQRLEYLAETTPGLLWDSKLLFGRMSFPLLLGMTLLGLIAVPNTEWRIFISISLVFAMAFQFFTGLFDEMEHIRHGMAARVLINMLLAMEVGVIACWLGMRANRVCRSCVLGLLRIDEY